MHKNNDRVKKTKKKCLKQKKRLKQKKTCFFFVSFKKNMFFKNPDIDALHVPFWSHCTMYIAMAIKRQSKC